MLVKECGCNSSITTTEKTEQKIPTSAVDTTISKKSTEAEMLKKYSTVPETIRITKNGGIYKDLYIRGEKKEKEFAKLYQIEYWYNKKNQLVLDVDSGDAFIFAKMWFPEKKKSLRYSKAK